MNLHHKQFKALSNSNTGEVSDDTIFEYFQENNIIWANYSGGQIIKGFLIGTIKDDQLHFSYQHINSNGEIMTGVCDSIASINENKKIILNEKWQWTCKDFSKGTSLLIEI